MRAKRTRKQPEPPAPPTVPKGVSPKLRFGQPTTLFGTCLNGDGLGHIQADFGECGHEVRRPTIYIVFSNDSAHGPHSGAPVLGSHLERIADGLRELFDIIWIHDEGVAQLATHSREPAQDEYAVLLVPGRHKFLGY